MMKTDYLGSGGGGSPAKKPDRRSESQALRDKAKWHNDRRATIGNANMAQSYRQSAMLEAKRPFDEAKDKGLNGYAFR